MATTADCIQHSCPRLPCLARPARCDGICDNPPLSGDLVCKTLPPISIRVRTGSSSGQAWAAACHTASQSWAISQAVANSARAVRRRVGATGARS